MHVNALYDKYAIWKLSSPDSNKSVEPCMINGELTPSLALTCWVFTSSDIGASKHT